MASAAENNLAYLGIYLEPLAPILADPEITDIYINRPGEIWIETLGGSIQCLDMPEITDALLSRLARQVANVTNQGINREHPMLGATLPNEARIQIIAPPASRRSIVLAIRKHASASLTLDDFAAAGLFTETRAGAKDESSEAKLQEHYASRDWPSFLKTAVRARKTIVIAGGTSTGKTTFLSALLAEIPSSERLILIEDTPEIHVRHQNAISLLSVRSELSEARASTDDLLIASLRMRPDRIILGEIRGREAWTFLRVVNVGHPGSLTTIHADSATRAIDQLALLILQSSPAMRREDVASLVESSVDIFVQLTRSDGRRRVTEIRWNKANVE